MSTMPFNQGKWMKVFEKTFSDQNQSSMEKTGLNPIKLKIKLNARNIASLY